MVTTEPQREAAGGARNPDAMIEVANLSKSYGPYQAIENISFHVKKGEILGFLGPNGAGKTTTMRILTGYMPPSEGTARIAGYDVVDQSLEARKHIGYLPESVPLYLDMTVTDYLRFMGTLRGMDSKRLKKRTDEVIDTVRIGDYRDHLIGKLSKGYRQRVGIAQAVIHEPDVLILDEPTIGIDPVQVVETRQLIRGLAKEHTVLLSTHILPEVEMVCQRVVIIHEGQIVAEDHPRNLALRLQGTDRILMEVRGPHAAVTQALRTVRGVLDVTRTSGDDNAEASTFTLNARRGQDLREELARVVVRNNWGLLSLRGVAMSLEEIFVKLTTEEQL